MKGDDNKAFTLLSYVASGFSSQAITSGAILKIAKWNWIHKSTVILFRFVLIFKNGFVFKINFCQCMKHFSWSEYIKKKEKENKTTFGRKVNYLIFHTTIN